MISAGHPVTGEHTQLAASPLRYLSGFIDHQALSMTLPGSVSKHDVEEWPGKAESRVCGVSRSVHPALSVTSASSWVDVIARQVRIENLRDSVTGSSTWQQPHPASLDSNDLDLYVNTYYT